MKQPFVPTKFLWIDLEMTGLVPEKDVILEVAAEVTDASFETLESYESRIGYSRELVLERMNENTWWRDFPDNRDDFLANLNGSKPLEAVEKELIALIDHHFGSEPAVLAGNSIHSDRAFIKRWMPELELRLHYRMLDVTSWKMVMQTRYGVEFEKPEVHRAFEDIQASIAELQFYLEWFHTSTKGNKDV
ncbi:MAG TPA: oligoribonuclease [Candidatus Saccharibacteria bacterium]|jgi:oligoribonuclease|nr:oligoribonuclease [Candidatus Saccharibacteria bacterium]